MTFVSVCKSLTKLYIEFLQLILLEPQNWLLCLTLNHIQTDFSFINSSTPGINSTEHEEIQKKIYAGLFTGAYCQNLDYTLKTINIASLTMISLHLISKKLQKVFSF
jgi:hypothetical protein